MFRQLNLLSKLRLLSMLCFDGLFSFGQQLCFFGGSCVVVIALFDTHRTRDAHVTLGLSSPLLFGGGPGLICSGMPESASYEDNSRHLCCI
mmetsp:Transcript_28648/g.70627  ORF Transcript_28648/g.70627 Transcript_28648/m.70627 type:complete len:91 (+) Transcript_28648:254-526(+)